MNARPILRLGAESPGGLMLPAASPTAGHLYAPRGVWTDGARIVVCDSGNHRVLIWHSWPDSDGTPADVVLGQPDEYSDGPAASGHGAERGMYLPTGVSVIDGRLVLADAWHHRLLVWDELPQRGDAAPAAILGQTGPTDVLPNRGGEPDLDTLYWPFGFGIAGGMFWIADTGNRRVLGWSGADVPEPGRPADLLLGQDGPHEREDNRGGSIDGRSFRWPHAITGDDETVVVADAGDHRVLGWTPAPDRDRAADLVLGQTDATAAEEFKNRPQGPDRMRFPYGATMTNRGLAVADTSNNRILLWDGLPRAGAGLPADGVLAQPDFDANGENRWDAVAADSLCWPYGIHGSGDLLAVADSGNNRVVLWHLT